MAYEIIVVSSPTSNAGCSFRASEFISSFAYETTYIINGVATTIGVAVINLTNENNTPYFDIAIDPQPATTETYTYAPVTPPYTVGATELQPLTKTTSSQGAVVKIKGIRCSNGNDAQSIVTTIGQAMQQYINQ
jgi:hypothetical protein